MPRRFVCIASLLLLSGIAVGQDSVPSTPGGNDALSAYDTSTLRTRYIVDSAPLNSSWGQAWWIAPVLKATRDTNPAFRTQILGSAAVSSGFRTGVTFPATNFSLWTTRGGGVHPTANAAGTLIDKSDFSDQFAVAISDFSLNPSNITAAVVGRDNANLARLYVTRCHAVASRSSAVGADTSTLSLGSVTPDGVTFARADNFNTLVGTSTRISGDNIVSFNPAAAVFAGVNTLFVNAGTNTATDATATTYILRNSSTPANTPTNAWFTAGQSYALIFDVAAQFRDGSSTANLTAPVITHRPAGVAGHRGNPSFSPITPLGGTAGTVAALAKPTGASTLPVNMLAAFAVNSTGAAVPTVTAGTPRAFTLPTPLSVPGFTANAGAFKQYLSQETFRGANGHVGVGMNALGQLVLAAVATDATADDFVAVVTATGPSTSTWAVAAYPGKPVFDQQNGATIGTIRGATATVADFSSPAVDLLGNVYFVATWKPTVLPATIGLFKAVNTPSGYQVEKLLSVGDSFLGPNSASTYTISALTLNDSDSLASGAFHSGSLLQQQLPEATTSDPTVARAAGGLIVNAIITYNNNGTNEAYDATLVLTPQVSLAPPPCPGDHDGSRTVDADDLFAFLDDWFAQNGACSSGCSADYTAPPAVDSDDLFAFLDLWFANNGTVCP